MTKLMNILLCDEKGVRKETVYCNDLDDKFKKNMLSMEEKYKKGYIYGMWYLGNGGNDYYCMDYCFARINDNDPALYMFLYKDKSERDKVIASVNDKHDRGVAEYTTEGKVDYMQAVYDIIGRKPT